MSADTKQDERPAEETDDAAADVGAETAEDDEDGGEAGDGAEPEELDLEERVAELELERIRIAADFANYQKRVNRDRAKWSQDAVRDLVASMLTVLDNLEHSITAFDGDVKEPSVYRQGVELVQSELLRVLKTYGLEPIEASDGTPFDPDQHQAVSVQPAEGIDEEQVAFVARTGYRLGDVILRPAQVVVRKPNS